MFDISFVTLANTLLQTTTNTLAPGTPGPHDGRIRLVGFEPSERTLKVGPDDSRRTVDEALAKYEAAANIAAVSSAAVALFTTASSSFKRLQQGQ